MSMLVARYCMRPDSWPLESPLPETSSGLTNFSDSCENPFLRDITSLSLKVSLVSLNYLIFQVLETSLK